MTDEDVLKFFFKEGSNKIDSNKISRIPDEYATYLKSRYPEDEFVKYSNTIWRIKLGIEECPRCLTCGKKLPDLGGHHVVQRFCCTRCSSLNPITKDKSKKTCLEKYGVEYSWQSENNKSKAKMTKVEKYGDPNYNNQEKNKATKIERYGDPKYNNPEKTKKTLEDRYGDPNFNNRNKAKNTCLERYNVENTFQSKDLMKKFYGRNLEKYGVSYYVVTDSFKEKSKKTCLRKYGTEYWGQSEIGRETLSYIVSSTEIRNKIKKTNNERYGSDTWQQSEIGRETLSYIIGSPEVQRKVIETKKKNGTTNTSEPERKVEDILREKFPDLETQYNKDDRYPFACDFYIPSLDLFIEYQGTWTHGFHVFDPNNEDDINTINEWKSKSEEGHNYYANAIKTWTISDPKKRDYAKKNNLNYIEFWSIDEAKEWTNER